MTIKETQKLFEEESNNNLRKPKILNESNREKIFQIHAVFKLVIDDIIRNPNRDMFLNSMFGKRKMKMAAGIKIKNTNAEIGYYKLTSSLGEGYFFDARKLFKSNEYPNYIKPKYCFNNTQLHVLQTEMDSKILSGISFVGKPFLHSVLLVGDNIIDFNYDLVMSKDLYCKLTSFEILEELDSKPLLENKELIINNRKHLKFPAHLLNFAFEEVVKNLGKAIEDEQKCNNISSIVL